MPSSGNTPYVGKVAAVSAEGVTIADDKGDHVPRLDANSFVRGTQGDQITLADIPSRYPIGSDLIVAHEGNLVINMRPKT